MAHPHNTVIERRVAFASPVLAGWEWPVQEIIGTAPGPRLCVIAGIHVNEVAAIEAALRLPDAFRKMPLAGSVAILPIVNLPGLPVRSQFVCPVDGKNINFSFPGSRHGTFSEALADALLNEWAGDADCLIDLHGGDLCESVARFTIVPTTGNADFDSFNLQLAHAFQPQIIVRLPEEELSSRGRSCSGRAQQGRYAVFAEAGANGVIDESSVAFHLQGVVAVARQLGMIGSSEPAPTEARPAGAAAMIADRYIWVEAPSKGWCRYEVAPAEPVVAGQVIATITDYCDGASQEIRSPTDGVVLWRCTHAVVGASCDLFGIGASLHA